MHGACLFVIVDKIPGERLDVAIENNAHDFALTVKRRAARVSSDDVRRRDVVQRRRQIQAGLRPRPALGEFVRRLVAVLGRMLKAPGKGGEVGNLFAILDVALYCAVAQAQREGGVGRWLKPLCANRVRLMAAPARRSTASTLSSYCLRTSRASGSISRISAIRGSFELTTAAVPPW